LLLGGIPVIVALLVIVPPLLRPEIPTAAVNSDDVISLEYSKQHLMKVSFGVTQDIGAQKTEILTITNDGQATYSLTTDGYSNPDRKLQIPTDSMKRLTALIKETGFVEIPPKSFPVKSDISEYDKFGLQVTLNGKSTSIQWFNQNDSQEFIPPLILQVQQSLDNLMTEIIK
jgi:hypothetical protein